MPDHLQLRRRTWYAVLDVPKDLREHYGKTKLIQSLKTRDHSEAKLIVGSVVSIWREEFRKLRGQDKTAALAAVYRDMRSKQSTDDDDGFYDFVFQKAEAIQAEGKRIDPDVSDETDKTPEAKRFIQIATGQLTPLKTYVDDWITFQNVKAKTEYEYRRYIDELEKKFPHIEDVTKRSAGEYVRSTLAVGRQPDTVGKKLSAYMGYWKWLQNNGYVDDQLANPWSGLKPRKRDAQKEARRRGYTDEEAAQMLAAVRRTENRHPDDYLFSLVMAATGMREDEVAWLTANNIEVKDDILWITVSKSKTPAGIRYVPIVDADVSERLLARKAAIDDDGYIFTTLETDKLDRRAHNVSKRLSRLLRLEVTTDSRLVAGHGWRHRARTKMEYAGVLSGISSIFIGHELEGAAKAYVGSEQSTLLVEAARAIEIPTH